MDRAPPSVPVPASLLLLFVGTVGTVGMAYLIGVFNPRRPEAFLVGDESPILSMTVPLVTSYLPLVVSEMDATAAERLAAVEGGLPPNVVMEVHDAASLRHARAWREQRRLHMSDVHRALQERRAGVPHEAVAAVPAAKCHLCLVVRSQREENIPVTVLRSDDHPTIGVLDARDVGIVVDLLDACGIDTRRKTFKVLPPPPRPGGTKGGGAFVSDHTFDNACSCVAIFCNLEEFRHPSRSGLMIDPDVRISFLEFDKHVDRVAFMAKHGPFAEIANYDMRSFFLPNNLTSNFPVVACVAFDYVVLASGRSDEEGGGPLLPREHEDQLVKILAQRLGRPQVTNMFALEFPIHRAVMGLLNEANSLAKIAVASDDRVYHR